MAKRYSISRAAEQAGITIHQARKYLHAGMIGQPVRTRQGWYRLDDGAVRRLRLIGLATDAGLAIREVAQLLSELDQMAGPCAERLTELAANIEQSLRDRREAMDEFSQQLNWVSRHSRCRPTETES